MTTSTETKLLCPECRRENEAERVYCHDCGTRLDRSAVRIKKEPIQDTHKRVKRMFDPQRAKIRAIAVSLGRVIFGAGMVALLVDMALPPDVPAPKKNEVLISGLRFDLESMVTKHQPPQKELSDEEANAFVASAVRSKSASLAKPMLSFKRAVIAFHERQCVVTAERSFLDYWSVYTTCIFEPQLKNGQLYGRIVGGHIGRLPIHPKLAQHMGVLFTDLAGALDRDLKLIYKMGGLEFHEKNVTISAPSAPATPPTP